TGGRMPRLNSNYLAGFHISCATPLLFFLTKSFLTRWCVTGRNVITLATEKIRDRPSLTHPTGVARLK
ncbi:hypothetical protein, partial [Moorena bouillonii]|uniref:hypothetical protein n=1 Tax=Moorena bouillonii TaxID=207920 RepID=UPI001BDF7F78